MKFSPIIPALSFCLTVSAAQKNPIEQIDQKTAELNLSDYMRNDQIPLEERDQTTITYIKALGSNLPEWLPYLAALQNLTKTSLYLLELGIHPHNDYYDAGWIVFSNPLAYAIQQGNALLAKKLLEKSEKKPDELMALFLKNMSSEMPEFLLAPSDLDKAIQERLQKKLDGQLQILQAILERGANPNPANNEPLLESLRHGNYAAAKLLIAKGAPAQKIVLSQEEFIGTGTVKRATCPLIITIENSWKNPTGAIDMIKILIQKGANVDTVGGIIGLKETNPLDTAIGQGAQEIARLLVEKGANIKKPVNLPTRKMSFENIPVINAAAYSLMPDMIQDLIKRGALVTTKSQNGMTPLHMAYFQKELVTDPTAAIPAADKITRLKKITEILLKNGANSSAQDNEGNTPLHYALLWENPAQIVSTLLDFTPDLTVKNRMSQTALDSAYALQKVDPDFDTKNRLAEAIMEKAGNRDWPSDEQIRAAYKAYWDTIITRLQS